MAVAGRRHARGAHPFRGASSRCAATPSRGARSRPGAPTRSAPTSPRSATRWPATPPTAARPPRARAPVPARPPARFAPSGHRRGAELRIRAAARTWPRRSSWPGAPEDAPRRLSVRIGPSKDQPTPASANGSCPAPLGSRAAQPGEPTPDQRGASNGRSRHQGAAAGRSPLRPPDAPLEPEHAPLHLRRARRDPHHRPAADRGAARRRPPLRRRAARAGAARSSSSAPRSRPATPSRSGPTAARCPTSTCAGWAGC